MVGKGPHTTCDCSPTAAVRVLPIWPPSSAPAAQAEHWAVDWKQFNALCSQSEAAASRQDFRQAVRSYSLAISFMMNEIRQQKLCKEQSSSS